MPIKRSPHQPLFRVMAGNQELMRFRSKDARTAKAEMRKQTSLLSGGPYRLERYWAVWKTTDKGSSLRGWEEVKK